MEIWKDIKGYEGYYQVSNLGNVKSLYANKERILKVRVSSTGYDRVCLQKNGIAKDYFTHRLVSFAFILNKENKPQVNHKNLNKLDNRVENLEWATASENQQHSVDNGRNNKHRTIVRLSEPPIIYHSIIEAAKETGLNRIAIGNCVRGKTKTSGGYKWIDYECYKNNKHRREYR